MSTHAHKAKPRIVPKAPKDDEGLEQYYTLADAAKRLKMSAVRPSTPTSRPGGSSRAGSGAIR